MVKSKPMIYSFIMAYYAICNIENTDKYVDYIYTV